MPHLSWLFCCVCAVAAAAEPTAADLVRPGVHEAGRWTYTLTVTNPGTRSEGRDGGLAFDGVALPAPPARGAYATPWGPIGWVGIPPRPWAPRRWMPLAGDQAAAAVLLPDPALSATTRVRLAHVVEHRPADAPEPPPWLADGLRALDLPATSALAAWEDIGAEPLVLHDSRHFGQAAIALVPPAVGDAELRFALTGVEAATPDAAEDVIRLPRRHGAHRVCRRAIGGRFGTIDVVFALQVEVDLALPAAAIGSEPAGPFDGLAPTPAP